MDPDNIPDQSKVAYVCLRITDFPELPAEATALGRPKAAGDTAHHYVYTFGFSSETSQLY